MPSSVTYTYIGDEEEEEEGLATFMIDYSPDGDGVWVFVLEYQGHQTGGDGTGGEMVMELAVEMVMEPAVENDKNG